MSADHHAKVLTACRGLVDATRAQHDDALRRRRQAIAGARADGLTLDQIADLLGITRPAVIAQLRERNYQP